VTPSDGITPQQKKEGAEVKDINAMTFDLVEHLRKKGYGGFGCKQIEPQCLEDWNKDYAIFYKIDLWTYPHDESDYFDWDRLQDDYESYIKDWFRADPTIKVTVRWGCFEVEVTRKKADRQ
jgi:hypothetical protein